MVLDSLWEEKRLGPKVDSLKPPKKGNPTLDGQKALHAAVVKCRFADTIFQARQKIKTDKADDPMKIYQEKKTFQRKLLEEKKKMEAQLMKNANVETRQRDRKEARIALENMEKTAGFELNLEVQREFEAMIATLRSPSAAAIATSTRV
ncbi:hypothetical protein V6N12_050505 [Hibiscus sabdariffa]|uniref:No apical meristem-associated C-terminal domain-containing protein n=1 Tax=Hibiscus sabdariffa TaxID=183260 RepID=A0ABR2GCK7_9ROSI